MVAREREQIHKTMVVERAKEPQGKGVLENRQKSFQGQASPHEVAFLLFPSLEDRGLILGREPAASLYTLQTA